MFANFPLLMGTVEVLSFLGTIILGFAGLQFQLKPGLLGSSSSCTGILASWFGVGHMIKLYIL